MKSTKNTESFSGGVRFADLLNLFNGYSYLFSFLLFNDEIWRISTGLATPFGTGHGRGAGFDGFVVRREGMGNGTLVVATLGTGGSRCLLESGQETWRRNGIWGNKLLLDRVGTVLLVAVWFDGCFLGPSS